MTTKFVAAALLTVLAAPAFANSANPGHQTQADLLKLDASQFTTNELAQIAAEDNRADRIARIQWIAETKGATTTTF